MQNMYQPLPKQRRRIIGTQEQCSQQKNEVPQEVIQHRNDMEEDDDDNEDKKEQEQKPEQQDDDYNEENEGTTTAAKSEGSDISTQNNMHTMHSSALDMYLEDAPVLELSSTDKTLFKEVVNSTLFKEVKFYSSNEEINHIMVMCFTRAAKMEGNLLIAWKEQNFGLLGVLKFLPGLVN